MLVRVVRGKEGGVRVVREKERNMAMFMDMARKAGRCTFLFVVGRKSIDKKGNLIRWLWMQIMNSELQMI